MRNLVSHTNVSNLETFVLPASVLSVVSLLLNNNDLTNVCMPGIPVIDTLALSNNKLTDIMFLALMRPKVLLLGNNGIDSLKSTTILPDLSPPPLVLGFEGNSVDCSVTGDSKLAIKCQCAPNFHQAKTLTCIHNPTHSAVLEIILAGIAGTVSGMLIILLVIWLKQRFSHLRGVLDLQQVLLEHQTTENYELRQAWSIDSRDIDFVRRIDISSPGAFGEVWLAQWDGLMVAVKRLRLQVSMVDDLALSEFEVEVDSLRKCRHRNIVRFFGAGTLDDGIPFLVMEFAEIGALSTYLQDHDSSVISAKQRFDWALDIQAGMDFLHQRGRIHRDLKTANVLLSAKLRAKVADLGSMKDIFRGRGQVREHSLHGQGLVNMTVGVGTPMYMAPEVIQSADYGPSADVWSFGVVLWEIMTQESPDLSRSVAFGGGPILDQVADALIAGHRLSLDGFDEELRAIIQSCWSLAPLARPHFQEIGERLIAVADSLE